MSKQVFVFLFFISVSQIVSINSEIIQNKKLYASPLSLLDDAQELLQFLGQLVLGNIYAAHDQFDDLQFDLLSHSITVKLSATVDVQQENQTLDAELISLKELAQASHSDISSCLSGNEDRLESLADLYLNQINDCISTTKQGSDYIVSDANSRIDKYVYEIPNLSFALGQCPDDETCISGVIDQIKQDIADNPLQIQAEVQYVSDQFEIIKVKIQDCYNTGLANFVGEGSEVIEIISDCVNQIIS